MRLLSESSESRPNAASTPSVSPSQVESWISIGYGRGSSWLVAAYALTMSRRLVISACDSEFIRPFEVRYELKRSYEPRIFEFVSSEAASWIARAFMPAAAAEVAELENTASAVIAAKAVHAENEYLRWGVIPKSLNQ